MSWATALSKLMQMNILICTTDALRTCLRRCLTATCSVFSCCCWHCSGTSIGNFYSDFYQSCTICSSSVCSSVSLFVQQSIMCYQWKSQNLVLIEALCSPGFWMKMKEDWFCTTFNSPVRPVTVTVYAIKLYVFTPVLYICDK